MTRPVALAIVLGIAGGIVTSAPSSAQVAAEAAAPALRGSLERVKVFGKSLAGNLLGESASPDVSIYLPASYAKQRGRRYPVVYLLHGYTGTDLRFFGETGRQLHRIAERVYLAGAAREMILVMPNAMNAYGGSMYSNSVTTGNWEDYVADDLVAYIDRNYRTLPTRDSRGLAGTSMGGYGTIRIGMKRPDVFAAIYALSSCCLNEGVVRPPRGGGPAPAEAIRTVEEARSSSAAHGTLARAAAWAPNAANPPLYFDLPTKNGDVQPAVAVKWAANSPVAMLDQYVSNLKKLKGIALDIGLQDTLLASNQLFVEALTRNGVAHTFETYEGDHGNRISERLEEQVLPFFSNTLSFEQRRDDSRR